MGAVSLSTRTTVKGRIRRRPVANAFALSINSPGCQIANIAAIAARNGNVIVVFMGLNRMKSLVPLLGKHFPPDTPIFVVYYAGIAGKERRMRTSLSRVIKDTDAEKDSFLGLVYIGRDLKDSGKAGK